jgi:hypothetical protein
MRDFPAFRASAIRYWEKRRIFYNLALILPALIGYMTWSELPAAVDDNLAGQLSAKPVTPVRALCPGRV